MGRFGGSAVRAALEPPNHVHNRVRVGIISHCVHGFVQDYSCPPGGLRRPRRLAVGGSAALVGVGSPSSAGIATGETSSVSGADVSAAGGIPTDGAAGGEAG